MKTWALLRWPIRTLGPEPERSKRMMEAASRGRMGALTVSGSRESSGTCKVLLTSVRRAVYLHFLLFSIKTVHSQRPLQADDAALDRL
ncbi:hypothetical protein D3C72_1501840 [compost metagenome]